MGLQNKQTKMNTRMFILNHDLDITQMQMSINSGMYKMEHHLAIKMTKPLMH